VNNCLINSFEYINTTLPGTMICDAVGFGAPDHKAAFLIKETQPQYLCGMG
jgi:hypothetical protein